MNGLLLDTNILIDYLRGLDKACDFLDNKIADVNCYISVITVAELYAGVREGKEKALMIQFLNAFEIVVLDEGIACVGGLYRRDYGKSHNVCLSDALIAASAELNNLQLITLNQKHFPMLKNVHLPY